MQNASASMQNVRMDAPSKAEVSSIPWHCWLTVLGAACIPLGALWDISWHSTIGRDTFWTPAHILIYLGGVVPGFTCGWLALKHSFWSSPAEKQHSVKLFNFHAPLGAWVTIWGAMAMLLAAPLDDWWHNAYGLDVEILSPPHTVLAAGMYSVAIGALLLILSWQNRASHSDARAGSFLFIFASGVLLTMSTIIVTEKSYPNQQHAATFYKVSCAIYPMYLVIAARAARIRWAATYTALIYMGLMLLMVWVLPLFKAQPLLSPIYNPVDRMVPPAFPLLLPIPALAIDLFLYVFREKRGFWWNTVLAFCVGISFVALFMIVQWYFSRFMLTPAAESWFFAGNRHWPYFVQINDYKYQFWRMDKDPLTASAIGIIVALAVVKTRIALGLASWMSKVQR
ncbi:MAG: hypothetical protein ACO1QB_15000 [Verrucomicrobiales bacterium]